MYLYMSCNCSGKLTNSVFIERPKTVIAQVERPKTVITQVERPKTVIPQIERLKIDKYRGKY